MSGVMPLSQLTKFPGDPAALTEQGCKAFAELVKCLSTFLVMVAENKKVRLSLGITFKILSTCQKKCQRLHYLCLSFILLFDTQISV